MIQVSENNLIIFNQNYWIINIIDNDNLVTSEISEELKKLNSTIYFNNQSSKYWIFDFKINDVWFEAIDIDMCSQDMTLNAYK
jgi:hypothetical protein